LPFKDGQRREDRRPSLERSSHTPRCFPGCSHLRAKPPRPPHTHTRGPSLSARNPTRCNGRPASHLGFQPLQEMPTIHVSLCFVAVKAAKQFSVRCGGWNREDKGMFPHA